MKIKLFGRGSKYLLVVLVLAISAAVVNAASVPHQFTPGTTAKSSQMNENFKYLGDRSWDRALPATDLYYNGGNVGIGTATPAGKLHLDMGSGLTDGILMGSGSTSTGDNVYLAVSRTAATGDGAIQFDAFRSGVGAANIAFGTRFTGTNVGIGTATPGAKLDVAGDINFTGTLKQNGSPFTGGGVWTASGSDISYSGGKVGIGTASPVKKLDVSGNARFGSPAARLTLLSGMAAGESGLFIDYGGIAADTARIQAESQGVAYRNLVLNPSGGNVGIGTTTPGAKLAVSGGKLTGGYNNGQFTAAQMDDIAKDFGTGGIAGNFAGDLYLRSYWGVMVDRHGGNASLSDYTNGSNPDGGSFAIRYRTDATTFRTDFLVNSSGNVGIGTTSPGEELSIKSGQADILLEGTLTNAFASIKAKKDTQTNEYASIGFGGGVGVGIVRVYTRAFGTDVVPTQKLAIENGVTIGSPSGGDKGVGTLNAVALYSNGTINSDYVFDWYFDGKVRDEDKALHGDYRMKSLEEMIAFVEKERHLPTIIGRKEWKEKGKSSLGELVTQLWETVETQAIYIKDLKESIESRNEMAMEQQKIIDKQNSELAKIKEELSEFAQMKARMAKFEAALDKLEMLTASVNE